MSQTTAVTHQNIRRLIDDLNPEQYAISSYRMGTIVSSQVQNLASRTFQPRVAPPETVALVAGTFDYTLTLANNFVHQLMLDSNGWELEKLSFEELNAYYRQDTNSPVGRSTPCHYAPFETNAQVHRIRVAPTPASSDTLNVYRNVLPAATAGESTDVPFSNVMLRTLEKACAIQCIGVMNPDDRERRKISPEVMNLWREDVENGVRSENWRQRTLGHTQTHIIRRGWSWGGRSWLLSR